MIVKPYEQTNVHKDPRQRAGAAAERQLAHYLHRSFSEDPRVHVLHGLRLEDRAQPEQDASAGVCQIDHLLVHRWGLFIIESKSVAEEVRVQSDGSGGDEWSRVYRGKEMGMPSPIGQARRQSEFLRAFLQRNREDLRGRQRVGLRTVAKLVEGTDQRGFKYAPIQLVIAVSDGGNIKRRGGWEEPREPFRVIVAKADLVADKIRRELERHERGPTLVGTESASYYGIWKMEPQEAETVAEFLADQHVDRPVGSPVPPKQSPPNRDRRSSRDSADGTGDSTRPT